MKKKLNLFLVLGVFLSVKAEFIAFKKFTHRETGKTIYMLYDIHVSLEVSPISREMLMSHKDQIQEQRRLLSAKIIENHRNKKLTQSQKEELNEPLEHKKQTFTKEYAELFRKKHFPSLYKQQRELLALVKKCGLSLVNEDWRDQTLDTDYDANVKKELQFLLGHKQYRDSVKLAVTPMQGIGEKLVGTYTENKLVLVPSQEKVYYYNVEMREVNSIDPLDGAEKVDGQIIKSIKKILEDKDKKEVIVSVGASHGGRISEILTQKEGYIGHDLKTNSGLVGWFSSRRLKDIVKSLKDNIEPDLTNIEDSIQRRLASHPIDLFKIFGEELPTCNLSTDSLGTFEYEISDFIKSLF